MSYDAFCSKVAANIRKARTDADLTQEGMEKFGFNIRHYQDIEGGKVNITLETIYRLAKALKVNPDILLKQ